MIRLNLCLYSRFLSAFSYYRLVEVSLHNSSQFGSLGFFWGEAISCCVRLAWFWLWCNQCLTICQCFMLKAVCMRGKQWISLFFFFFTWKDLPFSSCHFFQAAHPWPRFCSHGCCWNRRQNQTLEPDGSCTVTPSPLGTSPVSSEPVRGRCKEGWFCGGLK